MPNNWSWRIPSIFQGVVPFTQFLLVLFAPESPRYLICKGKEEQALKVLAYYHADGNENDGLVQYEFQEIKAAIELDRTGKYFSFTLVEKGLTCVLQSLPMSDGKLSLPHPATEDE